MSNPLSLLTAAATGLLSDTDACYVKKIDGYNFAAHLADDSLWLLVTWPDGATTAFRTAYAPDILVIDKIKEQNNQVIFQLLSAIGQFKVIVSFPQAAVTLLHYQVSFIAARPLFINYWPHDILAGAANAETCEGNLYINQVGMRSGIIHASVESPGTGSFLYLQNLTALNDYCQQTQTSAAGTVGGNWPELGFALPTTNEKELPASKEFVISDAYVAFDTKISDNQFQVARQFLELLGELYLHLPRPETTYHDFPDISHRSMVDLIDSKACWTHVGEHSYLNAYVCDYTTPPEVMVQLAVLIPLYEYQQWSGEDVTMIRDIYKGLPNFYDDKLKTIMRWLPAAESKLDKSSEQKQPKVMDAWYLHHPLLNLSRMALNGDDQAKDLFLNSIDYAIKAAQKFNYKWPVFYQMETLEILKSETAPGAGGEKDVAGAYAHIMLQAWELTKDKRYFEEAEKAARSLLDLGFDIFYQANNSAFSAGAMLRLYQETGDEVYMDLTYLFIANLFKNVSLWNCGYGYGQHFPTFFAIYPLNDAPYTAVYEEQEAYSSIVDLLRRSGDVPLLPSVSLLLAEFVRYAISRSVYYYPPLLPKEMLAEERESGELDPNLWIPLEDMHDGWEKSGSVGQEVYGAGMPFGIITRQYLRIPGESFLIYTDYPTTNVKIKEGKPVSFNIKGHSALTCSLRIIPQSDRKLPVIKVVTGKRKKEEITETTTPAGHLEFKLPGASAVQISWK
ncbi:hypothetical protein [Mucilaginibacter sp. HD30]